MIGESLHGVRVGRVIVLCRAPRYDNHARWLCICECGNVFSSRSGRLKRHGDDYACPSCLGRRCAERNRRRLS